MDTIVAPMTPVRKSGVILVRISGDIAPALPFFETERALKPNSPTLALFRSHIEPLVTDKVLLTFFRSPKSYTGEDILEISFHGNPLIVQTAVQDFLSVGIRYAERGEFTRRALLNRKITLSQAEATERLAVAPTPSGIQKAVSALSGELDNALSLIYEKLIALLSDIEANIDFAEDTADEANIYSDYKDRLKELRDELKSYADRYLAAKKALEGERVVIAGKVNAGKSTLFNYFAGEAAAIVTPEEGTTRDILTRTICLKGVEFILTDTAGLRETESAAEREGVLRAKEALKSADLILWLVSPEDIAEDPTALAVPLTDVKNTVIVGSKADLCIENSSCKERSVDVQVSAKTGFGMDKLKEIIGKRLELAQTGGIDLITDRQYEEAVNAVKELDNAILSPTLDIAAFSVKRGAEYIKDIGGREVSEAVLDAVFSRFCIGK